MALNQLDGFSSSTRLVRTFRRDQSCFPLPGEGHRTNYHRIAGCSKSPAEISLADELRFYCWKYKHRSCYVWENSKNLQKFSSGQQFRIGGCHSLFLGSNSERWKMCSHTLLGRTIFCMSKKYFLKLPVQIQFFNLSQKKMAWIHLSVILSLIALEFWLVNSIDCRTDAYMTSSSLAYYFSLKYIKVHLANRWTTRHGLMLLWFKDLVNVTEKLQFIDPTFRYPCLVPLSGMI